MFLIPEVCESVSTDAEQYACSLQLAIHSANRSTVAFFFSVAVATFSIWLSVSLAKKSNIADRQLTLLNLGTELRRKIEEMRAIAEWRGGGCLSSRYVNARTKLRWQCEKGHIWEAVPYAVKTGTWCPVCGNHSKKQDPKNSRRLRRRVKK